MRCAQLLKMVSAASTKGHVPRDLGVVFVSLIEPTSTKVTKTSAVSLLWRLNVSGKTNGTVSEASTAPHMLRKPEFLAGPQRQNHGFPYYKLMPKPESCSKHCAPPKA